MTMSVITMSSIYDGRALAGHVYHDLGAGTYEAVDPDNRNHGKFATHREAAAALPSRPAQHE